MTHFFALAFMVAASASPASTATPAAPSTDGPAGGAVHADPCADVFDHAPGCAPIDEEALGGVSEPIAGFSSDDPRDPAAKGKSAMARAPDPSQGFSADAMAWRLFASSGVVTVAGIGLFAASVAYGTYAIETGAGPKDSLVFIQTGTQIGAVAAWLVAGLLAGTGAIFLVFDPMSGRLRFDLDEGG